MKKKNRCFIAGLGQQMSKLDSYRLVRPVDPNEEEKLCYKQADTQVFMDSISVTLEPTEEAESKDADQEADKR